MFEKFDGFSGGAAWQDLRLGFEHLKVWKRTALVTGIDWMTHLTRMFGFMTPGEVEVFAPDDLEAAIAWAAGADRT